MDKMQYFDNWAKKGTPAYDQIYSGPRMDLDFGYNIMHGYYDTTMDPDILAYYKDYYTNHPEEIDGLFGKLGIKRAEYEEVEEYYKNKVTGEIYTVKTTRLNKDETER